MSVAVDRCGPGEAPRLAALLDRAPAPAWAHPLGVDDAAARGWRLGELADAAARGDSPRDAGRLFVARTGDEIVGAMALHRLEWEPRIFGIEMARIPLLIALSWGGRSGGAGGRAHGAASFEIAGALLGAARDAFDEWGTRHASALVPADETALHHAFEAAGWRLVDSTLEFAWEAGNTTAGGSDARLAVRPVEAADRAPLRDLARAAYAGAIRTRWSADPWLPLERTGELYARWFDEACDGAFADLVNVAVLDGRPIGFNTLKLERGLSLATGVGFAAHGIAAVDPAARGHGAQPAMLHHAAEWLGARGGRFARGRVLVQNTLMQRACLKSRGFVTQAFHTFHAWLGEGRA